MSESGLRQYCDDAPLRGGCAHQQGNQTDKFVAHLAPIDNHVDCAMLEQKLCSLETFGQGLTNRLLDDSGSRKANQCIWFRYDDVPKERETCRYTAHGRVGEYRNEWQARSCQLS